MGSDAEDKRHHHCLLPHAIKKDEKLTAISNGVGVPLCLSLHLLVSSPWIPATVCAVAMNMTYIDASIKAGNYLKTELPVSLMLIGIALFGFFYEFPALILGAICIHGFWDMAKHTCGIGVPFFGWYLSACAIFDLVYPTILAYIFMYSSE